jgi:hypothetical protein
VRILLRLAFYDIQYGVISPLYAGTAPAGAELNGKVTYTRAVVFFFGNMRETLNVLGYIVPDCVGACDASKRESPGCGATEEVTGMVQGPSEGLVMLLDRTVTLLRYDFQIRLTGTSQWEFGLIGLLETVESGPRCRPLSCWPLAASPSLSAAAAVSCRSTSVKYEVGSFFM